jgi:hypothetical protein
MPRHGQRLPRRGRLIAPGEKAFRRAAKPAQDLSHTYTSFLGAGAFSKPTLPSAMVPAMASNAAWLIAIRTMSGIWGQAALVAAMTAVCQIKARRKHNSVPRV